LPNGATEFLRHHWPVHQSADRQVRGSTAPTTGITAIATTAAWITAATAGWLGHDLQCWADALQWRMPGHHAQQEELRDVWQEVQEGQEVS
jgi:hypothetical protein